MIHNSLLQLVLVRQNSDGIYVINLGSRYKENGRGNWSLKLSGSGVTTLIDDSGKKFSDIVGKGRVFDVVSGSLNLGSQNDKRKEKWKW